MDRKLKERLIGVMVLVSLGIIFLPSLFHKEQRVTVDRTSLIPPKTTVEPIVIKRPQKNVAEPAPAPERAFQPPVPKEEQNVAANESRDTNVKSDSKSTAKAKPTKPSLDQRSLPKAWVVQLGSFQSQKRAQELRDKLLAEDYKAYSRPVNTSKGKFYRVFVGPYIEKSSAESAKKRVDKAYKVSSRILTFSPE